MTNTETELRREIDRLRDLIDCACNALTDSICCSGNDSETNLFWVKKLRKNIHPVSEK